MIFLIVDKIKSDENILVKYALYYYNHYKVKTLKMECIRLHSADVTAAVSYLAFFR